MDFPKRDTNRPKPPNQDEIMKGVCGTCKAEIEVTRAESARPKAFHGFGDLPSAECPCCGARVYLAATGKILDTKEKTAASTYSPQEDKAGKGIVEKMLDAMVRGEDLEISEAELGELEWLEMEAEKSETSRFLLDD